VWRFAGLGGRRTPSLRGGVSATAPLNWDGDLFDVTQLAHAVFTGQMGGPQIYPVQTEALTAWIDALPLLPRSPPADAAAVARGQALFQSAQTGCSACHSGARLTNNLNADVGTGRALQVPSLQGLSARAPYMHDGCAARLVLPFPADCGGGDRHGATSRLSGQQIADLHSFLDSL
jgi:mono/diheme cytochrome c family protein